LSLDHLLAIEQLPMRSEQKRDDRLKFQESQNPFLSPELKNNSLFSLWI